MLTLPLYREPPLLAVEQVVAVDVDPTCTKCSLHQKVRTPCMPAEGDPGGLLVLGSSPADTDDRSGRGFSSGGGTYVRELIKRMYRGPVVFDNAVRCAPGAREVPPEAFVQCRGYLAQVLREAQPARVLAFGTEAVSMLVGRSWPLQSTRRGYARLQSGVPAFFMSHPAHALRNRFQRAALEEDVAWALAVDLPVLHLADVRATYSEVQTAVDSRDACFDLSTHSWVTFDFETFGRTYDQEFRALALSVVSPDGDSYIWGRAALQDPEIMAPVWRLFADPRVQKGGQNVKFDAQIAARLGGPVSNVTFDTRLWRKMLQADAFTALGTMQPLVGMGGSKDEVGGHVKEAVKEIRKLIRKPAALPERMTLPVDERIRMLRRVEEGAEPKTYAFYGVPPEVLDPYCALDSLSTGMLKTHFEPQMKADPGVWRVWQDVGVPLSYAVTQMERNGIKASVPKIQELRKLMTLRVDEQMEIISFYGIENPGSGPEITKVLYEELRLPVLKTTGKKGAPSTDAETLGSLKHPLPAAILKYRRASKFKSQYADSMEMFIQDDGRIHPSIMLDGTQTGRPSCAEPNLFNIPRPETDDGKLCRDVFVSEEGWTLLEGDYSQIELRVAAGLSGDEVMLALYADPDTDFHLATAKMIASAFAVKSDDVGKEHWLRSAAKIVNFSVLYGKEAGGLAHDLNITKARAQQLIDAILGKFRRLKVWRDEQLAFGRKYGYCRTWWDGGDARVRPLWAIADANSDERGTAERGSWNTPVQGTATEFTNASIGAVQQWIERNNVPAKLVLTVYDSIILEVRDDALPLVRPNMKRIMEQWKSPSNVPIIAELKEGKAWGSLKKCEGFA